MRKISLVIILQFTLIPFAHAEPGRIISFYGVGTNSCGDFLTALSQSPINEAVVFENKKYVAISRLYSEWLMAYITAYNVFNEKKSVQDADINGVTHWVKQYCELKPMSKVGGAAWALVTEQSRIDKLHYK